MKEIVAYQDTIDTARVEGEKIGEERGKAEGKIEIAKSMLEEDEPIEKIMRYTGLSANY